MKEEDSQSQLLDSPTEKSQTDSEREGNTIVSELSEEAKLKLEVVQFLQEPCDRGTYTQKLEEAAAKLGKSKRTVQRLMQSWQKEGLTALVAPQRSDKGSYRIDEQLQAFIVKKYKERTKGSKRRTPKQVYLLAKAEAQRLGLKPPSHMTVYRILNPIIEKEERKKSVRSPGWRGSQLCLQTRDGKDLAVEYSNHVWQCDHTRADILLVDRYGEVLERPWLTTVIDSYSRCIVGFHLGYDPPSSDVVALALRHAILPKRYDAEYELSEEWGTYGKPEHLFTDGGKDFRSEHLNQIGVQLGFVCHLRDRPSEGGIVERPFKTMNTDFFATLPGYTGSNVQERPKAVEQEACLTLRELEKKLVRYIVDNYNQQLDARMGDQTRIQRWEAGLLATADIPSERELDICLMKQTNRTVQRGGHVQMENIIYRGEHLAGYEGEKILLRYNPRDITTVLVYRREGDREEFLTRAHAQDLETERISLDEAKAISRQLRKAGETINNRSIQAEICDRDLFAAKKRKSKKQRRKEEQTEPMKAPLQLASQREAENIKPLPAEEPVEEAIAVEEPATVEVFDYDELVREFGW